MTPRFTSFRLPRHLALVVLAIVVGAQFLTITGAPVPKPAPPYALLFVPKKAESGWTSRNYRYQFELLRKRSVLATAVRSLKNAHLPSLPKEGQGDGKGGGYDEDVDWINKNLKIEYLEGTGVLRVSMKAGTRREQALLVNAVVNAYLQLEVRRQKDRAERNLREAKKYMKTLRSDLATAKGERKAIHEYGIDASMAAIEKTEVEFRTLPFLLELAEVPPE